GAGSVEHQSGQDKGLPAAGESGHLEMRRIHLQCLNQGLYPGIPTVLVEQPLQVCHGRTKLRSRSDTRDIRLRQVEKPPVGFTDMPGQTPMSNRGEAELHL